MPTAFAITAATNTVRLDAARAGEAQFTVTNTSGRPLRARLRAVALQPEAQGWLTVPGEAERPFALGETQQVAVRIAAPPDAAAGSYAVRLDAAAEDNPDDDSVQGPSVAIEVPAPVAKKPFPWWIVAVIVAVLLVGGGAAFFLLRDSGGTKVPEGVVGQPVPTAQAILLAEGLTPGGVTPEANATIPIDVVIRTDPAVGEKVGSDEPVALIVSQGSPVTLPGLDAITGRTFEEVSQRIQAVCGAIPCQISSVSVFNDGIVFGRAITTDPAPGSTIQAGSAVTVYLSGPWIIIDPIFTNRAIAIEAANVFQAQCASGIEAACDTIVPTPGP
jgi:hypothetical protein